MKKIIYVPLIFSFLLVFTLSLVFTPLLLHLPPQTYRTAPATVKTDVGGHSAGGLSACASRVDTAEAAREKHPAAAFPLAVASSSDTVGDLAEKHPAAFPLAVDDSITPRLATVKTDVDGHSADGLSAYATAGEGEDFIDEFLELVGGGDGFISEIGVESLLDEAVRAISGESGKITAFFAYVFASALLVAVASLIAHGKHVTLAVSAIAASGAVGFIFELADAVGSAIKEMSELFGGLIPIMTGVTLAGGGAATAGVEAVTMGTVFGTVSGLAAPLLMPLSTVMLALSAASALGGGVSSSALSRVRSVFLWAIGIVTAILLGGIALQTVIASAGDSLAMRMAKYSASGLIPVIGGTVSASLSSLAAGLSYAKGVIGAGGIYALLLVALSPLLLMLVYRLALSLASGLLSFLGANEGAAVFGGVISALDAILSVYAVCLLLYSFEIIMFMKSGVALS